MLKTGMIIFMESFTIYLGLVLCGLCFGSFAGASVWRLRARQLKQDIKNNLDVDKKEYEHLKKLNKSSISKDRSMCLDCSYTLKWYDLIPLFSWLFLGGKCRKCHKPIGFMEPMIEIGMALFFVLSFLLWPNELNNLVNVSQFLIWLVSGVLLGILFVYDAKWFLLPDEVNFTVVGFGAISALITVINSSDRIMTAVNIAGSVFILSGIYFTLYIISKGKWIGFGDIKLGLGLGLLLSDWRLAFIALFAANLIGCFIVIPAMIMKKLKRDSHVPFGPLLILGFVVAGLVGNYLLNIYVSYL